MHTHMSNILHDYAKNPIKTYQSKNKDMLSCEYRVNSYKIQNRVICFEKSKIVNFTLTTSLIFVHVVF